MPCCLLLIVATFGPRLVIVVLALFTGFFERPFDGLIVPFLGFLFLPWTTLGYAWAINSRGEVAGIQAAVVIFAVLLDLGVFGSSEAERRKRMA